jgi:glycosyltransferase involved in cell wall biosynthesis
VPKRPKILFLTQIFDPEGAFKGLSFAKALRDRGFDVEVLTGFPNYPQGRVQPGYRIRPYQRDLMDGIVVHRVPLYPSHDRSSLRRSATYLSFFASALIFCLLRGRRYDAIYVYHPPMTVGFAAAVSGLFTRRPFVIDIQDLWPDSVMVSGMAGGRAERGLRAMCDFVYRRAARVVVQSNGMGDALAERGVASAKLRTIYNWADEQAAVAHGRTDLTPYRFENRFTFVYGGNMGPHQALDAVVEAAIKAQARIPAIQLLLVGEGIELPRLRRVVAERGVDAVRLMPPVRQSQIADVFANANVLVVHLANLDFFRFTVPSKTQFYLAMGKAILGGLEGEAAQLIAQAHAGLTVEPENIDAIADAMIELATMSNTSLRKMGESGRHFYHDRLSFDRAITETVSVLDEVTR